MRVENSTTIIACADAGGKHRDVSGVLHLPDALEKHPDKSLILYNRTSGFGRQSGPNGANLEDKEQSLYRAVRRLTDRPFRRVVSKAGERGKLSAPRRGLIDAAEGAHRYNSIVVASDLSRFLRPEAYDSRRNPNAEPTPEELQRLHEMTGGVVLATVDPPWLSEAERHSLATKRTGKAGRPRKIGSDRVADVFAALGALGLVERGDSLVDKWENPIRNVADHFGVGVATIQAIIIDYEDALSPDGERTYRRAALDAAKARGWLDENYMPPNKSLTQRECRRMRRDEVAEIRNGYFRRDGEPDGRYLKNRELGKRIDGEPDGRYRDRRNEADDTF